MKKQNIFQMLKNVIKKFFLPTHGKLLIHEVKLPKEVYIFQDEILSDLEMRKSSEDKINLRNDGQRLRKDARTAYAEYSRECVHG